MGISERTYWELLIKRGLGRLLVLARLLESPAHGYAIARSLKDIYPGCCEPSDAMIYPMLKQLYEGGYVACEARSTEGGRPQKL